MYGWNEDPLKPLKNMVAGGGLEPPTQGFSAEKSYNNQIIKIQVKHIFIIIF
jgi:hypothetical protein